MPTLADVFREYGPAYRARYGDRMLPSHHKAMDDIMACRTAALGGEVFWCDACQQYQYAYHSCGNRHCPTCGDDRADRWRDKQLQKRLPVPYFFVTFTLPHSLNAIARSHQTLIYSLLFRTSAKTLQAIALNPKWLGAQIGMVGVLQTWDRSMGYHVHVHWLLPAGGLDPQTGAWKPANPRYLAPGSALRSVFRATFRDALKAADPDLFAQVPPDTWQVTWNVQCEAVGDGRRALKYLTPYLFRVAISNRRILSLKDGHVTFSYKPRKKPWTTMNPDAMSFIRRFLQHVLPKGFQKIRYIGFLHPRAKTRFMALKQQLDEQAAAAEQPVVTEPSADQTASKRHTPDAPGLCPHCGGPLRYLGPLPRWPTSHPLHAQRGPPHQQGGGS